jgi:hypothetical protein
VRWAVEEADAREAWPGGWFLGEHRGALAKGGEGREGLDPCLVLMMVVIISFFVCGTGSTECAPLAAIDG